MKKIGVRENKMGEKKMRENKTHAKISWTKVCSLSNKGLLLYIFLLLERIKHYQNKF